MTERTGKPLLAIRQIMKGFPGVQALDGVNLTLGTGEVLAVIGENGAGKSTLMKILAGVQQPDAGEILIDGAPVEIDSVHRALGLGIALIHQELNLAGNLDVGANIFLGREPHRLGWIDRAKIRRESRELLDQVGLPIAPGVMTSSLALGQQQLVEIAKALSVSARILIMDEPTSSLSQGEADRLFELIDSLRARGISVIYISHRLGEVRRLADRVTVLRDGRNAGELQREEMTHDAMVRMMVGRNLSQFYARRSHAVGPVVLEVAGLRTLAYPAEALSFHVRAGEIVGVAGLIGAGRSEMLRTLFGVDARLAGTVRIGGQEAKIDSPRDAMDAGLALVPEDRKAQGLVIDMAVRPNVSLAGLHRNRVAGLFRNGRAENSDTHEMIQRLRIKTPGSGQIVRYLSGGNQQKVVIGKWLSLSPRLLLLDEPTRGIDVGAKQEIYQLIEELAEQGVAILFVSSELEEILGMSDRVLVMHEGRLTGELPRDQLSEEAVMRLATGATASEGGSGVDREGAPVP